MAAPDPDTVNSSELFLRWLSNYLPILLTAFLTALTGYYFTTRKTKVEQDRRAKYLATNLAVSLERYAIQALHFLEDYDFRKDPASNSGEPNLNIPRLTEFPESEDYKYLPNELYEKACHFRDEYELAIHDSEFDKFLMGNYSGSDTAESHLVGLASSALDIADSFRVNYKVKVRSLVFGKWDLREKLNERKRKTNG